MQDDRARQGKEICRAGVEFHNDDRRGKTSFGEQFTDPFVRLKAVISDCARRSDRLLKKTAVAKASRAIGGSRYAVRNAVFPAFDLAAVPFGCAGIDLNCVVGRGQNADRDAPPAGRRRRLPERLTPIKIGVSGKVMFGLWR